MDFADVLAGKRSRVTAESQLVKDFSAFDFHFVPDEPLMRTECETIIEAMVRFDVTGLPEHLAVIGTRGSGKTLTLKYLQRMMPKHADLDVLYANCRHHNTTSKIFAHLLGTQARGISLSALYDRFCHQCGRKTVVILDEIDLMSPKDRRREILYFLSRSEQPFMVIMLANSHLVLKEIDPATRSSLQPIPLYFRNYNAQQIQQILRGRAQLGLRQWDEGRLAEIAAMTTRLTHSDVRVAIKTLQFVATDPGDSLKSCFERARRDVVADMINDQSDAALMILRAAATSRSAFARDIYQRYCRISVDKKEKPFSYFYFCTTLSYLQSVALLALVATKKGRTYTNRVMLTFERAGLDEIFRLRFDQ